MNSNKKVFVGVSGGVDSSVSLALLKEKGFDVTGVFLKVWYPDFQPCDWKDERLSAMKVCAKLNVPFLTIDCEKEYKEEVVDYMINEYREGRVPNPDIFCNKYVKFGIFLKKALEMGADYIATGHYARVEAGDKNLELREGIDKEKDQSYFLYTLNQDQLKHIMFPIGHLTKPEVRKLAEKFDLPTAFKKDSQGLCFIGKVDIKDFLSHYIPEKKGDVLNTNGQVIGEHSGATFYTVGQRHGFIITKKTPNDPRYAVISKNLSTNTVTVAGKGIEDKKINNISEFQLSNLHLISINNPNFPMKTQVRIRYRQEKQDCVIEESLGKIVVKLNKPQSAISIGQSAVFYKDDICLGGGIIEKII